MDLSVIIVNYNVRQFLENALTSICRAMEGIDGEIFVVDNASDDGSVEMVKSKFPDVRLLVNPANLGFARANNLALTRGAGEIPPPDQSRHHRAGRHVPGDAGVL